MVQQWLAQCFTFLVLGIWIAVAQSSSSIPKQCLWNSHHKTKQKYRQICRNIYCRFFFLFVCLVGWLDTCSSVWTWVWMVVGLSVPCDWPATIPGYTSPTALGTLVTLGAYQCLVLPCFFGGDHVWSHQSFVSEDISRSGTDHTHNTIKTVCMFMCGSISHTNIFLGFEK